MFSLVLAYLEIKKAPIIDDREPFLFGDYDNMLEHYNKFCKNCALLDEDNKCLHRHVIQPITRDIIEKCTAESMFVAK